MLLLHPLYHQNTLQHMFHSFRNLTTHCTSTLSTA